MNNEYKRIIPCLLIHDRGLWNTQRFGQAVYLGDPINVLRIFNEKEVDEIALLHYRNSAEGITDLEYAYLSEVLKESFVPISIGGGVYKHDQIERLLTLGVEKVIIGKASYNSNYLQSAVLEFGSSTIVSCVDYKNKLFGKPQLYVDNGMTKINKALPQHVTDIWDAGVGEIILNCIDRDGMMGGYDLETISAVCKSVDVPVIGLGGCGSQGDIDELFEVAGASAAGVSSFVVHHGKRRAVLITYPGNRWNEF